VCAGWKVRKGGRRRIYLRIRSEKGKGDRKRCNLKERRQK